MEHKSFIVYQASEELIGMLSDVDCGKLMRALFVYARTKEVPELPDMAKLVFTTMRQYIDENDKKWESQREKRSQAGKISAQVRRAAAEKRAGEALLNGDSENDDSDEDPDGDIMDAGTCVAFDEQDAAKSTVSVSAPVSEFVSVSVSAPVSDFVSVSAPAPASAPVSAPASVGDLEQMEQERVQKRKQEILAFCEQSRSRSGADAIGEKRPVFFEPNKEQMNRVMADGTGADDRYGSDVGTREQIYHDVQSDCSINEEPCKPFAIPTYDEVAAYCRKYQLYTDPKRFFRINQESGWMCGGKPMRDWKAVLRAWSKNDQTLRESIGRDTVGRDPVGRDAVGNASERPMTPEEIEHEKMIEEWVQLAMNRPFDEVD